MSCVTINKEANRCRSTQATGRGLVLFLPSSSLSLSEAPLLSTFRGAGSAQADGYGHVPFSSESTERNKEKDRKEQKTDRKEENEEKTPRERDPYRSKGNDRDSEKS